MNPYLNLESLNIKCKTDLLMDIHENKSATKITDFAVYLSYEARPLSYSPVSVIDLSFVR